MYAFIFLETNVTQYHNTHTPPSPASSLSHSSILVLSFLSLQPPHRAPIHFTQIPPPQHPLLQLYPKERRRWKGGWGKWSGVCGGNGVTSGEQEKPPTPAESSAPFPHHRWLPSIPPCIPPCIPPALLPRFFSSLPSFVLLTPVVLYLLKGTVKYKTKMLSTFTLKYQQSHSNLKVKFLIKVRL